MATDDAPLQGGDTWQSLLGLGAMGVAAAAGAWWKTQTTSGAKPKPIVLASMPREAQLAPIQEFAAQFLKPLTSIGEDIIQDILPPVTWDTQAFWAEVHRSQFGDSKPDKYELEEDRQSHIHAIIADERKPHIFVTKTQKLVYDQKTWVEQGSRTWTRRRIEKGFTRVASSPIVSVDGMPLHPMVTSSTEPGTVHLFTDTRIFAPPLPGGRCPINQKAIQNPKPGLECYSETPNAFEQYTVELRTGDEVLSTGKLTAPDPVEGSNGAVQEWTIEDFHAPLLSDILAAGSGGKSYSLRILHADQEVTAITWTVQAVSQQGTQKGLAQEQSYVIFPSLSVPISWPLSEETRNAFISDQQGNPPWERVTFAGKIEDASAQEASVTTAAPAGIQDMSRQSLGQYWGDEGGRWRWDAARPWTVIGEGSAATPPQGWSTDKLANDYRNANLRTETVLYLHRHLDIMGVLEHVRQCASSNPPPLRGVDAQGGNLVKTLATLQEQLGQARNTLEAFLNMEMENPTEDNAAEKYHKKHHVIPATRDVDLKMAQAKAEIEALKLALSHAKQAPQPKAPVAAPVARPVTPVTAPVAAPVALPAARPVANRANTRKMEQQLSSWFKSHPTWSTLKGTAKVPITKALLLRLFRNPGSLLDTLPQNEQQLRAMSDRIFPNHPVLYSLDQQLPGGTIKMKYIFNTTKDCATGLQQVKTLQGRTPTACMKSQDEIWKLLHGTLQRLFTANTQRTEWLEQLRTAGVPPVVQYGLHKVLRKLDEVGISLAFLPVTAGSSPTLLAPQTYSHLRHNIGQQDRLLLALEKVEKAKHTDAAGVMEYLQHAQGGLAEIMENIHQRMTIRNV